MADDAVDVDDVVEEDDFAEVYQLAMAGDEDARTDLWKEFRRHSLNVIRYKAADLSMGWAVEPDDIYDSFFVALFARCPPIRFQDRIHFACYVEKSVRRSTKRTLQRNIRRSEMSLEACAEIANEVSVVEELIWQEQFAAASTALSKREKIICECVSNGVTWREVGQQLGIAEDTARMIYRRALSRIREQLLEGASYSARN